MSTPRLASLGPAGSCGQYEKISSRTVQERLKIEHRVGDVSVENKPPPYRWAWRDSNDKEYPEAQVKHFQILPDGKEQENGESRMATCGVRFVT